MSAGSENLTKNRISSVCRARFNESSIGQEILEKRWDLFILWVENTMDA